tara:strand:+ start:603 stop:998 length:396 start_codon:yes stop_codon:yes gene_type:complete
MATGKITFIEPAVPPTYQSKWGLMHAHQVTFADGNKYQFSSKGEFKKSVGDEIEYEVTNAQYKTAKLINNFNPMNNNGQTMSPRNSSTNDWILLQVCYKENMQAYAKENKDIVMKETENDFNELKRIFQQQ